MHGFDACDVGVVEHDLCFLMFAAQGCILSLRCWIMKWILNFYQNVFFSCASKLLKRKHPTGSPVKGSPEKTKTPPKKAKEEQTLTHGQPCKIQCHHVAEFKLWHIVNPEDKSDAFVKMLVDELRSDQNCELHVKCEFRGDVC